MYNTKKQKLETKKGLRIKKTHLITLLVLVSILVIGYQYLQLKREIGNISQQDKINVTKKIVITEIKKEIKHEIKQELEKEKSDIKATFAYINGNWSEEQLKVRVATEIKIREIAKQENFKHTDYIVKIADCESMLGLKLTNNQGNYPEDSVDEGYFMWNSHWQKEINERCAYDLTCETLAAIKKVNAGGQCICVCDKYVKVKTNFR